MNLKCHLIKLNLENYNIFLHEDWDEYLPLCSKKFNSQVIVWLPYLQMSKWIGNALRKGHAEEKIH